MHHQRRKEKEKGRKEERGVLLRLSLIRRPSFFFLFASLAHISFSHPFSRSARLVRTPYLFANVITRNPREKESPCILTMSEMLLRRACDGETRARGGISSRNRFLRRDLSRACVFRSIYFALVITARRNGAETLRFIADAGFYSLSRNYLLLTFQ